MDDKRGLKADEGLKWDRSDWNFSVWGELLYF